MPPTRGKQNTSWGSWTSVMVCLKILGDICCPGLIIQLLICVQPYGLQHAKLPCPSPTPGVCSDSCPSSWWCHTTISSSVIPCSSCLPSFPASRSFPMSQSLHYVAKLSELQVQHQSFQWIFRTDFLWDWLVGSPCSPRDSQVQVFSNTTVQKHQFFGD